MGLFLAVAFRYVHHLYQQNDQKVDSRIFTFANYTTILVCMYLKSIVIVYRPGVYFLMEISVLKYPEPKKWLKYLKVSILNCMKFSCVSLTSAKSIRVRFFVFQLTSILGQNLCASSYLEHVSKINFRFGQTLYSFIMFGINS